MHNKDLTVTHAVGTLRDAHIPLLPHFYTDEEHGVSAQNLHVAEHNVFEVHCAAESDLTDG